MDFYLGVDAGGTKTLAVVVDREGKVRGVGMGGPGNFQGPGVEKARQAVKESIDMALKQAGLQASSITSSYFGMAGADRPQDFEIVRNLLLPVVPSARWSFENDAVIGLFAGESKGVGVGVVCGTGTNVVAVNREGKRTQVGGMGTLFGDRAGGSYIAVQAIARAMRGHEGRGEPTRLYDELCKLYGLDSLIDLVDYQYAKRSMKLGTVTPLVFQLAAQGDTVARQILIDVGEELGIAANAAIDQLFSPLETVSVVGIGSVFQKGDYPLMFDTFVQTMKEKHPQLSVAVLNVEPVFGAVYGAVHLAGREVEPSFEMNLSETFTGRPK